MRLKHSTALIVGGASGLGAATVQRLVAEGMAVVLFDRDVAGARALAASLGDTVTPIVGDILDESAVLGALRTATGRAVRLVVNCAFAASFEPVISAAGVASALDDFRRVIEVNLVGSFNVLRLAAQEMAALAPDVDGERGLIVNVSSIAGLDGRSPQIAYSVSKGAVAAMTLPAARDLAPHGIRTMTIAPGAFATAAVEALPADFRAQLAGEALFPGRLGAPAEFAALICHLATNPFLNAEVIRLDAGTRY